MNPDSCQYNPKLEQKYFYLPRIFRKSNRSFQDFYENKPVRIIKIIYIYKLNQNELIFDTILAKDNKIVKDKKEIYKIKEDAISMMILENKKIPPIWTKKNSYLKILKKIFNNNDEMKSIAITNQKNNEQREIYNQKLKDNFRSIKIKNKPSSIFLFDNDLATLMKSKRKMKKLIKIPKIRTLNEEYQELISKQNIKIETPKPDMIKKNLKNIFNYRKNIALRFKYNSIKFKGNLNPLLIKSKSQIINSLNKINIKNKGIFKDNSWYENNKEYEDKLMLTGMNNKKFKNLANDIIVEEKM